MAHTDYDYKLYFYKIHEKKTYAVPSDAINRPIVAPNCHFSRPEWKTRMKKYTVWFKWSQAFAHVLDTPAIFPIQQSGEQFFLLLHLRHCNFQIQTKTCSAVKVHSDNVQYRRCTRISADFILWVHFFQFEATHASDCKCNENSKKKCNISDYFDVIWVEDVRMPWNGLSMDLCKLPSLRFDMTQ